MRNGVLLGITFAAITILLVVLAGEGWPAPAYVMAGLSMIWLLLFAYANSGD